jgi:hypothetical protein
MFPSSVSNFLRNAADCSHRTKRGDRERKFFHDPQYTKLLSKPAFTSWKMFPDRLASDGKNKDLK